MEQIKVLIIGNNPIELGTIKQKLDDNAGQVLLIEYAFDEVSAGKLVERFVPDIILLDDNLGKKAIISTIAALKPKTDASITLLKTHNYEKMGLLNVEDFMMKSHLTQLGLLESLKASMMCKSRLYFKQAKSSYQQNKEELKQRLHAVIQKIRMSKMPLS
jgi:chemotaxis response regulator CheB